MARFNADDVEHYGGQGGAGFLRLANDGDVVKVRFMYRGIENVEGLSVHEIKIDNKRRYVNCLRSYSEPVEKCPFCKAGRPVSAKLFVPVYDEKEDRVKIWERGKKFFAKISGLCSRYPNLVEHVFEVERHGKAGDTNTTYEIYNVDGEKLDFEDLPEVPEILGGVVLDKSADDMECFLETGEFPPTDDDSEERPVRRRSRNDDLDDEVPFNEERESRRERRSENRQSTRRTPASSRRRNEDAY